MASFQRSLLYGWEFKAARRIAKFWLKPVSLAKNKGFRQHELDRIAGLVVEYEVILVEAWHDYFDS